MGLGVALWVEPLGALAQVSAASWVAWVYLLVFGTLVALNAYLWLLQNTSAALAGSYSFVNPAVALLVGVGMGGERLTGWVFAALPLVGAALAFILYGSAMRVWWVIRAITRATASGWTTLPLRASRASVWGGSCCTVLTATSLT